MVLTITKLNLDPYRASGTPIEVNGVKRSSRHVAGGVILVTAGYSAAKAQGIVLSLPLPISSLA